MCIVVVVVVVVVDLSLLHGFLELFLAAALGALMRIGKACERRILAI